jgi:uncharacterized protein
VIALLAFVLSIVGIGDVQSPRPNGWVVDQANILDVSTEDQLNTIAEALHQTKNIELAIVVVDDVRETPKQFATALFNNWGIGSAQTNTGVLVLLVMGKRRLEIETGTGIEAALTSQWLADMQAKDMVPRFKQADFAGGLVAGVRAIAEHLDAAPGESTSTAPVGEYRSNGVVVPQPQPSTAPPIAPADREPREPNAVKSAPEDDGVAVGMLAGGGALGLAGLGGVAALLVRRRKRLRTCFKCTPNRRMLLLDEVEDDKHLDAGEQTEERLGSVDYDVFICPGCQDSKMIRHNKWFSGYSTCTCSYKTLKHSSHTIVSATYDHGGQVQVTEDCMHCGHHSSYIRYTSALTRPSDSDSSSSSFGSSSSFSSSSSSSGFGGGSSSGGGAGSSW